MSCTSIMISSLSSWHASIQLNCQASLQVPASTYILIGFTLTHHSMKSHRQRHNWVCTWFIYNLSTIVNLLICRLTIYSVMHSLFFWQMSGTIWAPHTRDFARPFKYLIVRHSKGYASHTPTLMIYILCTPCHVSISLTQPCTPITMAYQACLYNTLILQ